MNRQLKYYLTVGLLGTVIFFSGCGIQNDVNDFVVGKNRISCANATITVTTPFELVFQGKQAEYADKSIESISAEGRNRNLQMFVIGQKVTEKSTVEQITSRSIEIMKNNPSVIRLNLDKKEVFLSGLKSNLIVFDFTEKSKGIETNLVVWEYIFQYDNVVWRVIYQYRKGDPIGAAIVEKISGQIIPGITF